MIKHIIFDMDGVLVDARELHYLALNRALESVHPKFVISKEEHLSTYDGLNTSKKLEMLTLKKGLYRELHQSVWDKKQMFTNQMIKHMKVNHRLCEVLKELKRSGYTLHVASNSIRDTVKMMLLKCGYLEYIDMFFSNQDVKNPKPSSEIYLRSMIAAGVNPSETLIIEDSNLGRKAALDSGGHLCPVMNSDEVTLERIMSKINSIENKGSIHGWEDPKLNVLIPMAGAGSRFESAGYTFPKPLIEVEGKPMIQVVVDNLNMKANHIFIVRNEHDEKYHLKTLLNLIAPGSKMVKADKLTEGAACTTLLAEELIDNDNPLILSNSDQFLEWDPGEFMYSMRADNIDGGIVVFNATHPKWSFAAVDENGFVTRVAEKEPISDIATVGVYYWAKGSDYVKYAKQMIEKNIRVNNEFYVAPVYNEAIQDGKKVKIFHAEKMWGLGTPEDLNLFLNREKKK